MIEHFGKCVFGKCLKGRRYYASTSLVIHSGIAAHTPPSSSAEADSVRQYYAIYLLAIEVKEEISDFSKIRMMRD